MKVSARLARLEKAAALAQAARSAAASRAVEKQDTRDAAWAIMRQTMSEEHARLVAETYAVSGGSWDHPLRHTPGGRLLRHCLDAIDSLRYQYREWPYSEIPPEVILAMPPVVAEVFLERDELRLHECEACGYKLPMKRFEACPLCGGRVGYSGYYTKRKAEAEARSKHTIR